MSQSATLYLTGLDADGDLLDYVVTRLPSHGVLELESTLNASERNVLITNVTARFPFRCWLAFSRYRLVWWPDMNSEEDVSIGIKAYDGSAYSDEATIEVKIIARDGVPKAETMRYTTYEDTPLHNITLHATDTDTQFISIVITELPTHGTLYTMHNSTHGPVRGEAITRAYSEWEVLQPVEMFASNVRAVSSFWSASDDASNGYPSWHPFREYSCSPRPSIQPGWRLFCCHAPDWRLFYCCRAPDWRLFCCCHASPEILGPQDAPNHYGDSALSYCPSSLNGDTAGVKVGGDEFIRFAHDTWASYLSEGFTEYIEVEFDLPVYIQSIELGENRGLFSIVSVKAWDNNTRLWQTLYSGEADPVQFEFYKDTNQYHKFAPSICQSSFASAIIRIELDTYSIEDWVRVVLIEMRRLFDRT